MALIKCHECGSDVSTEAKSCPKCGAPVKLPPSSSLKSELNKPLKLKEIVGSLFLAGGLIWWFASPSDNEKKDGPAAVGAKTVAEECKPDDLQCLGDKGIIAAGVYCKEPIERLAIHDVKWTDGAFEMKFSRFRWKNKAAGLITYLGDKAEFQNGFGAYTPVIYECDLSADNKTVIDVRVQEGRLPS